MEKLISELEFNQEFTLGTDKTVFTYVGFSNSGAWLYTNSCGMKYVERLNITVTTV